MSGFTARLRRVRIYGTVLDVWFYSTALEEVRIYGTVKKMSTLDVRILIRHGRVWMSGY